MTTMALPRVAFPQVPHVDRVLAAQVLRYGLVGALGTGLTALSYLLLRVWWDAVPANLAALVLSTLVSTEINRRFTFGAAVADRRRENLQNVATVAFNACYGSAVLVLLAGVVDDPSALQESVTVAGASVLGGAARFLVLRNWVFGDRRTAALTAAP